MFTYGKLVGLSILGLKDDSAVDGDTSKVGIQLRDSGQDSTLHSHASLCIAMVLVLDGNVEIGAHVWSEISNLICLRHLFISRAVANLKSVSRKVLFSPIFIFRKKTRFKFRCFVIYNIMMLWFLVFEFIFSTRGEEGLGSHGS